MNPQEYKKLSDDVNTSKLFNNFAAHKKDKTKLSKTIRNIFVTENFV